MIKEAQRAGIAHAQTNDDGSKYRGRKPTFNLEQFRLVQDLLRQGIPISAIAQTTGLKRQSIYRIQSKPEQQLEAVQAGILLKPTVGKSPDIFMLQNFTNILYLALPGRSMSPIRKAASEPNKQSLQAFGINDFLNIDIPAREMLLSPILPERSLAMLYAPRGVGKSWLGLSMGLAVAAGESLLRWSAPRQRNVLYIDGEMPLVSLQERLR